VQEPVPAWGLMLQGGAEESPSLDAAVDAIFRAGDHCYGFGAAL